ncbi:MAG: N-acetylneuraminate synthase family protein [Deltaproteobacteria bacterium]|nr:N-acetylneuraminate synthase family protein [Deltaproteobacteria bacterium]
MKNIILDNTKVGHDQPCFIISEIGAMYEDIEGMKKLIKASKDAGVNAVKIQTYRAETIALPGAEFEFEDGSRMPQIDFFKQYEISREDHKILFDYAREIGICMFSTPSYYDDVDFLDELKVPAFKTGSDDLTNYPFLEYIARKGKPMVVSTGMATLGEVEEAVNIILKTGNDQLILLHCTTSYPPETRYANLNIMKTLQLAFDVAVGYSDHIPGIFSSVLAASMGAYVIEKHVTLDRNLKRQDYQVSIEPSELKKMVDQIQLIPVLQGLSVKKVYPQEEKWRQNARKSLVAARNMKSGEILRREDIKIIRPGSGIHPRYLDMFAGKILKRDLAENEVISKDDM